MKVSCCFVLQKHPHLIERFSNDCRKTKTRATIPTNHNRNKQHYEPITIPTNYLQLARSAGKITRTWCDFGSTPHWLKNWRESFQPITRSSNRNRVITFDSHVKTALTKGLVSEETSVAKWNAKFGIKEVERIASAPCKDCQADISSVNHSLLTKSERVNSVLLKQGNRPFPLAAMFKFSLDHCWVKQL